MSRRPKSPPALAGRGFLRDHGWAAAWYAAVWTAVGLGTLTWAASAGMQGAQARLRSQLLREWERAAQLATVTAAGSPPPAGTRNPWAPPPLVDLETDTAAVGFDLTPDPPPLQAVRGQRRRLSPHCARVRFVPVAP